MIAGSSIRSPEPADPPPKHLPAWPEGTGPWFETTRLRSLGLDVRIRTTDAQLGRYLDRAFRDVAGEGPAETTYSVVTTGDPPWPYALYQGSERMSFSASGSYVVEHLLWDLNRRALDVEDRLLLVHAGAVVREGVGVLLPGPSGAGKTTLTAGLVLGGADYLSDELAVVDTTDLTLRAHPSPLVIKGKSRETLADLRPRGTGLSPTYVPGRWLVPASTIRPGALASPARPGLIVAPRYVAGTQTRLEPVSRANMIALLASQALRPRDRHAWTLQGLRDVVAACACYRLTYGDLADACAEVAQLTTTMSREQVR